MNTEGPLITPPPVPASSASTAIEIRGVEHWFTDERTDRLVHAVAQADFAVATGEFVAIVGPSGCGKTTLLNIVSGLVRPTRGSVHVNGKPVVGIQPAIIGYMVARDTLLPWRTALSNVEFGLAKIAGKAATLRAAEYLRIVGLAGFESAYPDQLSQGMRQRVALARTIAASPQILLMDEPFGALDAQTKLLMEEEFLRIWEADRKTVLFVTHDLTESLLLADRVIVMSARPCRIKSVHRVALPRPRDLDELQSEPAFNTMLRQIWHDLRSENPVGHASA